MRRQIVEGKLGDTGRTSSPPVPVSWRLAAIALLAGCVFALAPGHAQEAFPSRTVKLVVPAAGGSTTDTLTRIMADQLGRTLGQAGGGREHQRRRHDRGGHPGVSCRPRRLHLDGEPAVPRLVELSALPPPATPAALADRINRDVVDALKRPDVAESLARLTLEPMIGTPADAAKFFAEETRLWGKVVAEAHIRLE